MINMAKVVLFLLIGVFGIQQTFGQVTRTAWSAQNNGMSLDGVPVNFMPGQEQISAQSAEAIAQQYLSLLMRQNEQAVAQPAAPPATASEPGTDKLTQLQLLLEGISPTQLQNLVDLIKSRSNRGGSPPAQPAKTEPPRQESQQPPPIQYEQPQQRNSPSLIPPPPGSGNRGPSREARGNGNGAPQPYGQNVEQTQHAPPQPFYSQAGSQDNIPPWARNGLARNGPPMIGQQLVRGGSQGGLMGGGSMGGGSIGGGLMGGGSMGGAQMGSSPMGGGQNSGSPLGGLDPNNPMIARLLRVLSGRIGNSANSAAAGGEAPEAGEGGMNPALMAMMIGGQSSGGGGGGDLSSLLGLGGLGGGNGGGGGSLASLLGGGGGTGTLGALGGGNNPLAMLQALGAGGQSQIAGAGVLQALLGGGQNTGGSGMTGGLGGLIGGGGAGANGGLLAAMMNPDGPGNHPLASALPAAGDHGQSQAINQSQGVNNSGRISQKDTFKPRIQHQTRFEIDANVPVGKLIEANIDRKKEWQRGIGPTSQQPEQIQQQQRPTNTGQPGNPEPKQNIKIPTKSPGAVEQTITKPILQEKPLTQIQNQGNQNNGPSIDMLSLMFGGSSELGGGLGTSGLGTSGLLGGNRGTDLFTTMGGTGSTDLMSIFGGGSGTASGGVGAASAGIWAASRESNPINGYDRINSNVGTRGHVDTPRNFGGGMVATNPSTSNTAGSGGIRHGEVGVNAAVGISGAADLLNPMGPGRPFVPGMDANQVADLMGGRPGPVPMDIALEAQQMSLMGHTPDQIADILGDKLQRRFSNPFGAMADAALSQAMARALGGAGTNYVDSNLTGSTGRF